MTFTIIRATVHNRERFNGDAIHVVDQLDWHNNPPSRFFAEWDRENYASSWLKRLSLCGLLGDRQNYLRLGRATQYWPNGEYRKGERSAA